MDDIEERLRRYRPAGPPHALRARVVGAVAADSWWSVGEWLPAVAAVMATLLFYWLSAAEHGRLEARFPSEPQIGQADVINVEFER